MSPVTHFLVGWMVANVPRGVGRRERAAIAIAGVAPDLDGLGVIPEVLTRHSAHPLNWFSEYHHVLGHNVFFAIIVAAVCFAVARQRRWLTTLLAAISFHLHLLCDVLGGRGPDGYQWPVPYLAPLSERWTWTWSGQWALNAWPNFVVTGVCLAATFYLAWRRGYSPVEIVSPRADAAFVGALRQRFPLPAAG
ncbi:MAG TPA: metal-dependent hydrolase [Terriglobales bacterium]|nr:metal-dependent hydrolase [Terriglobales bacterium]